MAQTFLDVRMLRTIDQCVQVMELEMGQVYTLTADLAQRLIDAGACEPVTSIPITPRLEAAALAAARRRG